MKLAIKQAYSYAEPVSIKYGYIEDNEFILDHCDHAGADEVILEYTIYSSYDGGAYQAPDDSEDAIVLYCHACNCYENYSNEWIPYNE